MVVLLPGMDGTAELFAPLREVWDAQVPLHPVRYDPADATARYPDRPVDLPDGPLVLVGESFSGPIAMQLARDERVVGLVLCCTFATSPVPRCLRLATSVAVAAPVITPPALAVRRFMVGRDADDGLVSLVRRAIDEVPAATFRRRVRDVLTVDAREALGAIRCPVLVLSASNDWLVPRRCTDELLALRPDAEHVSLQGPHLLLQARPRAAALAMANFAQRSLQRTSR